MILSIVSGTFNRITHLVTMVKSARLSIPAGMDYEIILVDGGSTDGTLEWARQQPDIRLIEHGALFGAIKAFTDGAKAAISDYVLLANDDITFLPNSIMPAITHLERTPACGAVAFMDDRPAPGYGGNFKVQTMTILRDKQPVSVPYAQVGLYRRFLGNLCGWWGADDTIMGWDKATYGGDNFLSARIYERGYTVDSVESCRVQDNVVADDLRQRNQSAELVNPGAYYKRYPTPPVFNQQPVKHEHHERLRVLYMPIYERPFGKYKRGLREALARVGLVWELDYVNERYDLAQVVRDWQPHLLLMQAHSHTSIPLNRLVAARVEKPDMVVVNWNGDVYSTGLTDAAMLAYLRHVDLQLVVNESAVEVSRTHGIQAAYWQIGFEPVDYDHLPNMPVHDVVFLANGYSEPRRELGEMLRSMAGVNVGLYGQGWLWGNGDTTYRFSEGAALYRNARIAIGDNQYTDQRGFVSNRLFEALASGVFLLHQHVPGLEDLTGLRDGVHYVSWTDTNDLQDKIHQWLDKRRDAKRRAIADAGREYVHTHHSFDARVQELFKLIGELEHVPA
jgi:glycosyltransferase involved in cell wall biosynthesis